MTKTALITGGSRGIGAATADMLRARGWTVVAPARSELDLTNARIIKDYTHLVNTLTVPAHLDALVLCAGEWYSKEISEQPPYEWIDQYELNVVGPWLFMVRLLNILHGGCIVAVASTRAFIGGVETAPYSCAKAALVALMQGFAREYGGPVRFNCVCPGLTDTDMGREVVATGGAKPGAVGQPAEAVAAEIVRLIESDDNGRVMRVVDGAATEAKWTWG